MRRKQKDKHKKGRNEMKGYEALRICFFYYGFWFSTFVLLIFLGGGKQAERELKEKKKRTKDNDVKA